MTLRIESDASLGGESVLVVDYPPPNDDPAGRDVACEVEEHDWSRGRAISIRVKSAHPTRISVSFLDRNRVVYTTWADIADSAWHPIEIAFDRVKPNPYFQPPGARTGAPIDVSEVNGIAFAPQDKGAGRLLVSRIVLLK